MISTLLAVFPGGCESRSEREQNELERPPREQPERETNETPEAAEGPASESAEADRDARAGARSRGGGEPEARETVPENSDERFREAMRRFDRRLERERFGVTQGDESPAGGGAGEQPGRAGSGETGGEEPADSDPLAGTGNPFEDEDEDDSAPPSGQGGIGERTRYSPPPGTPDGSDDDVVARQLRQAAEQETDPELRAKLWAEYRAYKNDRD